MPQKKRRDLDREHARPAGLDDTTVEALGILTEALERVERARGHLYAMHQLTGGADLALDEAVRLFNEAGHHELADRIERDLVGRNVIEGRWTFQLVEEYDDGYYALFRELERHAHDTLAAGRRHIFEAEMKQRRRTPGKAEHKAKP
jgi:hypothetical protein